MSKNSEPKSEFARFALNTTAKPESLEKWMNTLYGVSPRESAKKRRK